MKIVRHCKRWKTCPLCLSGVDALGHLEFYAEQWQRAQRSKEDGTMGIKKPDVPAAGLPVPHGARSGDDWVLYPTLLEYLTEDRYEDGSSRRTATLTIFADAGTVKASINDRDTDRVAFVSATSLAGLLVVIEEKLASSSADWRTGKGKPQRRK